MGDDTPDPIAQWDQARRAMVDLASGVWRYYGLLVAQGFTPEQALALTRDMQRTMLTQTPDA